VKAVDRWKHGCEGKARFRNRLIARLAVRAMPKRLMRNLELYRCEFCGSWHLGHPGEFRAKHIVKPRKMWERREAMDDAPLKGQ
jgi:hypothetical protein